MSWRLWWLAIFPAFFASASCGLWKLWWRHGSKNQESPSRFRSVYRRRSRAMVSYFLGISAFYYAAYVLASLVLCKIQPREATIHLAIWTLAPALWFFFEWFVWFDNHDNDLAKANLQVAQDLSSKLWAAVLAVMIAYRLADIVLKCRQGRSMTQDDGESLG